MDSMRWAPWFRTARWLRSRAPSCWPFFQWGRRMSELLFENIRAQLAEEGEQLDIALEAVCAEIWELCQSDAPLCELASARSLGVHFLEIGCAPSAAASDMLLLGRALVREATSRGLDGERARKW